MSPDFFLGSTEVDGDLARVRSCWRKGRLECPHGAGCLAVTADPPIIGQPFGLGGSDITDIIVSPHYEGDSLFPITQYPVHVYIYRALRPEVFEGKPWSEDDIEMIAWGELYADAESARRASRHADRS